MPLPVLDLQWLSLVPYISFVCGSMNGIVKVTPCKHLRWMVSFLFNHYTVEYTVYLLHNEVKAKIKLAIACLKKNPATGISRLSLQTIKVFFKPSDTQVAPI